MKQPIKLYWGLRVGLCKGARLSAALGQCMHRSSGRIGLVVCVGGGSRRREGICSACLSSA